MSAVASNSEEREGDEPRETEVSGYRLEGSLHLHHRRTGKTVGEAPDHRAALRFGPSADPHRLCRIERWRQPHRLVEAERSLDVEDHVGLRALVFDPSAAPPGVGPGDAEASSECRGSSQSQVSQGQQAIVGVFGVQMIVGPTPVEPACATPKRVDEIQATFLHRLH